ncbi:hypothetical protein BN8_02389 [Fibrisoma limi BUZ 3]|uniref:Uncharacterized protein n=1 Tax=Fibrisoma limi BUZ 3 TaxID=1185876 RepID=I2GHC9_9BACT|nr:hypothetical protein [Fibrisoma limi]CCH53304.1 hypothetical protein BN8_02389 [Fibrisoma limi BUZ 3]
MQSYQLQEQKLWGLSLIIAPLLFSVSSFFWNNGEYTLTGGTLLVIGSVFWIPAFMGLFAKVRHKMPTYATWGLLIAIYGCISGSNFGIRGLYADVFGITKQALLDEAALFPLPFNLTMFWAGPLFPLSLLVLGIVLIRSKAVPVWTGLLLCVGALCFPLSRIPRSELMAHIADGILLVPLVYLGVRLLRGTDR